MDEWINGQWVGEKIRTVWLIKAMNEQTRNMNDITQNCFTTQRLISRPFYSLEIECSDDVDMLLDLTFKGKTSEYILSKCLLSQIKMFLWS